METLKAPSRAALLYEIDALFGLVEAQQLAINSLINTHPNRAALLKVFDFERTEAQVRLLNSHRSELAMLARADYDALKSEDGKAPRKDTLQAFLERCINSAAGMGSSTRGG